jgi:hypothetical protein
VGPVPAGGKVGPVPAEALFHDRAVGATRRQGGAAGDDSGDEILVAQVQDRGETWTILLSSLE